MTTLTDTSARTGTELLYLRVNLGNRPSLEAFNDNLSALLTLGRFAGQLVPPYSAGERLTAARADRLTVVRTSLASPWVTVLSELARNSAPIGYGTATLIALHRLLNLVMRWQKHRQDVAEREVHIEQLRLLLDEERRRFRDVSSEVRRARKNPQPAHRADAGAAPENEPSSDVNAATLAAVAARRLGEIQAAELIQPDDQRAIG
ncbi:MULTISPECIES: hypothetical protein [unclassified Amycolatopsis]|uniref:hypothetical protein n=1 Tax=unclassified Amycolatopsis TaxID=2618356 RepID=UPI00106E56BF|nr:MULTISPECIES: hypothetical protein [unclassified Amycolatopsis]